MTNIKSLLLLCVLGLSACATPEFRAAQGECTPGAFTKYPVEEVQTLVTRSRPVQVPSGLTQCSTSYHGNQANTTCFPIMRTEFINYQELAMVDKNKPDRDSLIKGCAQALCLQRYGNAACNTPAK
ncbi:MAG: hypothetical protein RI902_1496 [Pseudomonadota bacterium]|jgi:hypothetical protein